MTDIADFSKGQTDISYKGELQTLTKQSMRHQVSPGETCRRTISEINSVAQPFLVMIGRPVISFLYILGRK